MPSYKWLTPDSTADPSVCRVLSIPAVLVPFVGGALGQLAEPDNWEQFGTVTIDEITTLALEMSIAYLDGRSCMIGAISIYATAALPDNVLTCDGTVYNRVDYPALYAVLDSAFIVDADTFQVPDLRGRAVLGNGTGSGLSARAVGDVGGEENHQLTVAELASHRHAQDQFGSAPSAVVGALEGFQIAPESGFTGYEGSDNSHNNMQPFAVLRYGIVAR